MNFYMCLKEPITDPNPKRFLYLPKNIVLHTSRKKFLYLPEKNPYLPGKQNVPNQKTLLVDKELYLKSIFCSKPHTYNILH